MSVRAGSSKLVLRWMALTLGASIFAAVDGGWLAGWAALAPSRVWYGEVWRLASWPWIQRGPLSLLVTLAAMYKLGGDLTVIWGERRLRRFVAEIVIGASFGTCLIAALTGGGHLFRLGGWTVADVLTIAWARQFPDRELLIYGLIKLRGRDLVRVTVGVAILFAIFQGPVAMAPELLACLAAAGYPRGWLTRLNAR